MSKVVILAGDHNPNLEVGEELPKSMIQIAGHPMLEWQIRWLKSFGYTDFIICAGYCQKKIVDFLGSGKKFGIRVGYSVEVDAVGTAGALKCAESMIGEDNFIVINGDIVTNLNIKEMPANKILLQ